MGKNKAQRTKNNAKPSNSSRSAQLLGTSVPNFVGFSAVTDGGYVPVLPGLSLGGLSDVATNAIDSSFQMALKKMNKKDATTKFKALQEFAELCRESDISSVEAVLPFWPRSYCLLSIDVEHRVREAAQTAHAALVKRVGKNIAVYLKQIAGPWFTSQFDTYPPAASTATNSFRETFPQRKIVDAIVHCQAEILSYIEDTITVQTPQSMSTNKMLTAEELETKYQKVLIASLQAYCSYLKQVPAAQIEKTEKFHQRIIGNNRFWKLPKHESVLVKTGFFNVLASLVENATVLVKNEKKRVMTAIMNSLDESEPGLLSAVWESMLVAINKIDDWYLSVSIEKLVLPKLWKVLKSGGQCCASVVYPNLLPFVSQFPKFNVDNKTLFANFFSHMRQGFSAKSVLLSRSEMFAVTKSFIECLRYAILLHKNDQEFCEELVKNELIPIIELCIVHENSLKSILFCEVTQLIRYWSKNRENSDYKTYEKLVKKFWHELESMFKKLLTMMNDDYNERSNIHVIQMELLLNLKNAPTHSRKNLRVKFSNSDETSDDKCRTKQSDDDEVDDSTFVEELDRFVNNLCVVYLENNANRTFVKQMEFVNSLVANFDSERLFVGIVKTYRDDANLFEFYEKVLKNWLIEKTETVEAIVQLIFSSLKYMDDTKKETVLQSLAELEDMNILRSAIACALSEKSRNDEVVRKWCMESRVTEQLYELARKIGNDTDVCEILDEVENIIVLAFATTTNGELCVSEEAIDNIASILCENLDKEYSQDLSNIVEFVSKLLSLTWRHSKMTVGSIKMLKSLFQLSIRNLVNLTYASIKDTTIDTWKGGFAKASERLTPDELGALQRDCLEVVYATMYSSFDSQVDEAIVDITVDFIESVSNFDPDESLRTAVELNICGDIANGKWINELLALVLYAEILYGNYYVSESASTTSLSRAIDSVVTTNETLPDRTEYCLKWALFNLKLLNKLLFDKSNDASDSDTREIISSTKLPRILFFIIHITDLGCVYRCRYKSAENYQRIDSTLNNLIADTAILRKSVAREIWPTSWTDFSSESASWVEWRSLMSQFGQIFSVFDDNTLENDGKRRQLLNEYVESNDETSVFQDINAITTARKIIVTDNDTTDGIKVLERMVRRHQSKSTFLLHDRDIGCVEWNDLALPLNVIRLLSDLVRLAPTKLSSGLWDACVIFLAAWQQSVNKSIKNPDNPKTKALIVAVSELYHEVRSLMMKHKRETIPELSPNLLDEWENVFADDVHHGIANTWIIYANLQTDNRESLRPLIVLDALSKAVSVIDGNTFFTKQVTGTGMQSPRVTSNEMIDLSLKLLTSRVSSLQLAAYHVINRVIPKMVEQDKLRLEDETFESNDLNIRRFENVLTRTHDIVNDVLAEFKVCDTTSCTIQPYTDAYTYTVGYLLAWANVLDMCAHADADLRYLYAEFFKDDYFPFLLNNIFRLIYQIHRVYKTIIPFEATQNIKAKPSKLMELFRTAPSLEFQDFTWTEWRLDHIACWVFTNCLRHLPVLVRQWWSNADSRISSAVEKITTVYVSPMLCQEELLNKRLVDIENMQVKVHPSVREVVALYQMDDTKLELSMVLPENHPLGLVTVEPGQHVGGAANWRNCHMQLSIFLTHHNGSIWDGLLMWKKNLDKKFSGVEECFICYSIFHINTYQIPKLSCHTCRKKFHAPCLYKWFTTSQKSTCPICRNIF